MAKPVLYITAKERLNAACWALTPPIQPIKPREVMMALKKLITLEHPNVIHIAGTKGKGTVAELISWLLRQHGLTVGTLTSPHRKELRDRIQINGEVISYELFARYADQLTEVLTSAEGESLPQPRFTTMLTALGILACKDLGVQVMVMETGIGGRTDSTNVMKSPLMTIITKLGLDHQRQLGPSLAKITEHKADICRPGVPALTIPQERAAMLTLKRRVARIGTKLTIVSGKGRVSSTIMPNTSWQKNNETLAVCAAKHVLSCFQKNVGRKVLYAQLAGAKLPGKFEVVKDDGKTWLITSAHNLTSVEAICDGIEAHDSLLQSAKLYLLFAQCSSERPAKPLLQTFQRRLRKLGRRFNAAFFCPTDSDDHEPIPASDDSLHALADTDNQDTAAMEVAESMTRRDEHAQIWKTLGQGGSSRVYADLPSAMQALQASSEGPNDSFTCVVAGATYLAANVRTYLQEAGIEGLDETAH